MVETLKYIEPRNG